ncbi:MAG: hypothetical protein IKT00_01125, partial [Prevotella sp.]|nr:hypothetical protein [Prevotella sp.]
VYGGVLGLVSGWVSEQHPPLLIALVQRDFQRLGGVYAYFANDDNQGTFCYPDMAKSEVRL